MARYFHLTTTTETKTVKVPENWFPSIEGGLLLLPDGSNVEAAAILSSRFESKRETPAKDRLCALIASAKEDFGDEYLRFKNAVRNPDNEGESLFDDFVSLNAAYTLWRTAELNLQKHEENVRKSAEAAKKKKENPTPKAEAKPKAASKKK